MRLHIEYSSEGGGDLEAIELFAAGGIRELTYEAMDEVLKADISEPELAAITQLLNKADLASDRIPYTVGDSISLSYETSKSGPTSFWGESGSAQFDTLLEIWIALKHLARRYFTPRFY